MSTSQRSLPLLLVIAGWGLASGAGMLVLLKHETTPGPVVWIAKHWPVNPRLSLDPDRPTLIMFAHPRCPCTRASIEELARLLTQCQVSVGVHVLFFRPADSPEEWGQTDLWSSAAAIPGVCVSSDPDGVEAKHFGSVTSGHVVLYDPEGRLLFSGGITGSRGHSGDNTGRSTLLSVLNGERTEETKLPVFGCELSKQSESDGKERPCQE